MRRIVHIFLLICFAGSAFAQTEFKASAPNVVETGERFRLVFELNADGTNFNAPVLADFQILSGPNPSSSSSIRVINGKMEQSKQLSYTYILQANKVGRFTIPSASITSDGKVYRTQPVVVEAVNGSSNNNSSGQQQQSSSNQSNGDIPSDEDLFIKIHFSNSKPYVGEPILATFKFYSRVNLYNISDATMPKYTGFYSKELNPNQRIETNTENIGGKKYITGVVQKVLLIPQKSGNITIDPASLEFVLIKQVRPQSFFDDGRRKYTATVKSKPVTLQIKALPANKPSDFSGAVGSYTLNVQADKTSVKANEAITIKTTISGTGNLKLVDEPKLNFPPDFEIYDPKVSENIQHSASGMSGSKTFEYLIIPRHEGSFTIPPVTLSFFDTKSNTYKTLRSDEIVLDIAKGEAGEQVNIVQGYSKEDIQYLGKDIKFIATGNLKLKEQDYLIGSLHYFAYIGLPFLALLTFIIFRFKQIKENSNIAKVRNKKANKVSQKRLKLAKKYLDQGKGNEYYEELTRALWGYLSDKLTIPVADLTKDTVAEKLQIKGIEKETADAFLDILNQCEYARYAPEASEAKEQLFDQAKKLITIFENKLK